MTVEIHKHNTNVEENIFNKCRANILIHKGYLKINKKKINNSLSCESHKRSRNC